MKYIYTLILLFSFLIYSNAQESESRFKLGFNYGFGQNDVFPFSSDDYTYEVQSYRVQVYYHLKKKGEFDFGLNFEPAYYRTEHQLLNKYFVTPEDPDYLEKREEFTQLKTMNEYVFGIGFKVSYPLLKPLEIYAIGSVGPMYIDTETERMAKGFAFSDAFSLGLSYKIKTVAFDVRYGVRHVSNANLQSPNSGYNSTNVEFGVLFDL